MKKLNKDEFMLDFSTGKTTEDRATLFENYRNLLYKIKNPYVGNKRKIIADIAISLEENNFEFDSICDAFSGSSAVSLFFKLINKNTISNDILTSSYYNALAFVYNNNVTLSEEENKFLVQNQNNYKNNFIQSHYSDKFTKEESLFLDNYRANVTELFNQNPLKEAIAIVQIEHYIINHCFVGGRLNKGQILASLEHRLNHARNDGKAINFNHIEPLPLFSSKDPKAINKCFNCDVYEFLNKNEVEADLLYLDPPYGGQQSNYSDMFAFCEEYIYSKKISQLNHLNKKFVSKTNYEDNFRKLLELSKKFPLLAVSYNESSWSDINHIRKILMDYRKDVNVISYDYKYKYRNKENTNGLEYLILCKN